MVEHSVVWNCRRIEFFDASLTIVVLVSSLFFEKKETASYNMIITERRPVFEIGT